MDLDNINRQLYKLINAELLLFVLLLLSACMGLVFITIAGYMFGRYV